MGRVVINGKELDDYFGRRVLQTIAVMPFEATHTQAKFDVRVNVDGGGMAGQAGAIRHGIARALSWPTRTCARRSSGPASSRATRASGAQEGRPQEGPQAPAVLQALARDSRHCARPSGVVARPVAVACRASAVAALPLGAARAA